MYFCEICETDPFVKIRPTKFPNAVLYMYCKKLTLQGSTG